MSTPSQLGGAADSFNSFHLGEATGEASPRSETMVSEDPIDSHLREPSSPAVSLRGGGGVGSAPHSVTTSRLSSTFVAEDTFDSQLRPGASNRSATTIGLAPRSPHAAIMRSGPDGAEVTSRGRAAVAVGASEPPPQRSDNSAAETFGSEDAEVPNNFDENIAEEQPSAAAVATGLSNLKRYGCEDHERGHCPRGDACPYGHFDLKDLK